MRDHSQQCCCISHSMCMSLAPLVGIARARLVATTLHHAQPNQPPPLLLPPPPRTSHTNTLQVSKWEVELKSDNSPLTKADRVANQIICHGLQLISPHIPIVSEENRVLSYDIRKVRLQ